MTISLLKKALSEVMAEARRDHACGGPNTDRSGDLLLLADLFKKTHDEKAATDRLLESMAGNLKTPFSPKVSDKADLTTATNRVALWRFFERYVVPAMRISNNPNYINPFSSSSKLLPYVLRSWRPLILKESRRYSYQVCGGDHLIDEFVSVATIGLLESLERQAMDIIAMSKKAQLIPFHLKLRYGIQRQILQNNPALAEGGIRYTKSKDLNEIGRIQVIGLDDLQSDPFTEGSDFDEEPDDSP